MLYGSNSVISKLFWFCAIDITFWALGDLRKTESGKESADLAPNGVLQFPLLPL